MFVGVRVPVGVSVGVGVVVAVAVLVGVLVAVFVGVLVDVLVAVLVGVGVAVAVEVAVFVGVGVETAPGWKLRSWFLFPASSSCCMRMCTGAPLMLATPWPAPQYALSARWPPQTNATALPELTNVTVTSAVLLPDPKTSGLCTTELMDVIVPP